LFLIEQDSRYDFRTWVTKNFKTQITLSNKITAENLSKRSVQLMPWREQKNNGSKRRVCIEIFK
jgi:hypothetical protein